MDDIAHSIAGAYAFASNILAGVISDLIEQGADGPRLGRLLKRIDDLNSANIVEPLAQALITDVMAKAYATVRDL